MLNLRIVCVDYYMSGPVRGFDVTYSSFRIANVKQVPVIRVFGITPDGIKACIHIHGVFPYIYVPYDGGGNPHALMCKIAQDIDVGINNAGSGPNQGISSKHHVFKITLVGGIPFYGYHEKSHQFFKIYFYNPYSVKKAIGLLESGFVAGMKLQPHEAHIPFILQFFIDYNLYGMSFMKLSSFKIRQEALISNAELGQSQGLYKMSYCELEGDTVADCILNKISAEDREEAANPGLSAIWEEEKMRRLKEGKGLDSLVQQTQTIHDSQPTASDLAFRQQLYQAIQERLISLGEETSQVGYAAETPEGVVLQDASFRDNHNLTDNSLIVTTADEHQPISADEIFNEEDLQLIKVVEELMGIAHVEDETEQDSILGSQPLPYQDDQEINESMEEDKEDLTLPFSPTSSGSIFEHDHPAPPDHNAESYEKVWSPWEDSYWTGCGNMSQISSQTTSKDQDDTLNASTTDKHVDYVDGPFDSSSSDDNMDIETNLIITPTKKTMKVKDLTPESKRYLPLNISVERSPGAEARATPQKQQITPKKHSPKARKSNDSTDSVMLLKELQENASQINKKLLSPTSSQKNSNLNEIYLVKISDNSYTDNSDPSSSNENKKNSFSSNETSNKSYLQDLNVSEDDRNVIDSTLATSNKFRRIITRSIAIKSNLLDVPCNPGDNEKSINMDIVSPNVSPKKSNEQSEVNKNIICLNDEKEARCSSAVCNLENNNQVLKRNKGTSISLSKKSSNHKKRFKNLLIQVLSNASASSKKSPDIARCKNGRNSTEDCNSPPSEIFKSNKSSGSKHVRKALFPTSDSPPEKSFENLNFENTESSKDNEKHSKGLKASGSVQKKCRGVEMDPQISSNDAQCTNIDLNDTSHLEESSSDILLISEESNTCNFVNTQSSKSDHENVSQISQFDEQLPLINSQESNDICGLPSRQSAVSSSISSRSRPYLEETLNSSLNADDTSMPDGIISFYNKSPEQNKMLSLTDLKKSHILTLSYNPPSRNDVIDNMLRYGLRIESGLMPFYGNPRDESSSKEVGIDLVQLPSVRLADLEDFIGDMGNPLEEYRKIIINNVLGNSTVKKFKEIPHLVSNRKIIIAPVRRPPTRKDAEIWKRKGKEIISESPKKEDLKGMLEMAMFGGCQNSSQPLDLTPCTPTILSQLSTTDTFDNLAAHSTPTVPNPTVFTPSVTPIQTTKIHKESLLPVIDENEELQHSASNNSSTKVSTLGTQLDINSAVCDINNATPENSGMFKMELQNLQDAHSNSMHRYITLLAAEIHCLTRGDLRPDPEYDAITAIFYCVHRDIPPESNLPSLDKGVIFVQEQDDKRRYIADCTVTTVPTEMDLIHKFISLVRELDPDIVAGYETEMLSWGYIIQRGYILGFNLTVELSRINTVPLHQPEVDMARGFDVKLIGRITLNVWRLMRHEVALMSYSFETMMYHVLHTRVPKFSFKTLRCWWTHRSLHYREFVIRYYLTRVIGVTQILDQLDFIGSTSELASLFGIQFYEVLSRGSQFRVESMMIRLARLQNFVSVSPSIKQRAEMRAPACIPLVMEPKSRFYGDPVILLDFQSLYPSMMIAYNYCFSTCLGRMEHLMQSERFEFGCTELKITLKKLNELKDKIHISPVGIAFVTPEVRKGTISKMVEEILETRLMVKKSMKDHKDDKLLQRVLHARQLGLKLIANVTYGYTSANFSGRMPSVEVADSIVSKGRETLERVIEMINSHPTWGARVVYGDTDSVFVHCPGRTRQEAFIIGQEIADAATKDNPKPVKLKLEKVYQPCILQTKKRYVGFMYESPNQTEPEYDAKGIETVRRDGCPAVSKILEKSLKILFKTRDVSQVKDYVCNQMSKLFTGRINMQDVTFAKEYRGIFGYKPGACVPALKIAREILQSDRRGEPRAGERVGYVIICGPPGVPLIKLTTPPAQLIQDPSLRINAEYYILKAILPPLDRCFTLIGANVFSWYQDFPKKYPVKIGIYRRDIGCKKSTISQYFSSMKCVICGEMTSTGICTLCQNSPHIIASSLAEKSSSLEYKYHSIIKLCKSCCEGKVEIECTSLDCPVMYRRVQAKQDLSQIDFFQQLSEKFLPETN